MGLSKDSNRHFRRSKLQLVGASAILIASKYEEIYAPHIDELVYITDNTYQRGDLLAMEWQVLDTLMYDVSQPTPCTFLPRILKGNSTSIKKKEEMLIASLSASLAELAVFDYKITTTYLPSLIASSCVLLANFILFSNKPVWTQTLQILSGNYRPSQLHDCCNIVYSRLREYMCNAKYTSKIIQMHSSSMFWSILMHNDVTRSIQMFSTLPCFIFADFI